MFAEHTVLTVYTGNDTAWWLCCEWDVLHLDMWASSKVKLTKVKGRRVHFTSYFMTDPLAKSMTNKVETYMKLLKGVQSYFPRS